MRILLVDDEVDILEQAEIFLQREVDGLSVETVSSAEKALDLLEEDRFDAVVSDYQMPEMDGLEFLETVREEKGSDIPFIIFTGKGREAVAMEALNLGADRYLQKGGSPKSQYGVLAQAIVQEVKHSKTRFEKAKVEADLSSIVKGSGEPIYIVDEECRIVFANQAELEKTGMGFEEIIGSKFGESHPEGDAREFGEKVKKALETGEPQRQVVEHEGSGKHYDRTLTPVQNPRTGKVDRVAVISKDITELKKREEEVRDREEKFRELFENQVNGFAIFESVFDDEGNFVSYKFVDINPAYERITGVDREEVEGKDIQEVFPGTEDSWIEAYGSVAVTGESKTFEMYHGPTDKHYLCNVFRPWDTKDRFCVAFNDVTERKKEKELLENVFDRIPVMITIYDPDMEEFQVNEEFEQVLGWSNEEIENINLMEKCYPDPEYRETVREYMESATVDWRDLEVTAKDGSKVESSWSNIVLPDDRRVGIGIDKTKLKEKERELKERVKELKCLYGISKLVGKADKSLEERLRESVELIPPGWQYQEITCARLVLDGEEFKTENYNESEWKLKSDILVDGEKRGFLEVVYLEERPELDEGPFLKEERELIEAITERLGSVVKSLELKKELRESEKKYRAITEKSHDAIFIIGRDSLLFVNDRTTELTGYGKEELYDMDVWELLHPEDRKKVKEIDRKGREKEKVPTKYKARIVTKEGEIRFGDFRVTPIEYDGEYAVLGTVRDITERKEAEETLKKSREEFKNFAENSSDILMKIDPDGEYTYVSRDIENETGYSRDEVLDRNIRDFLTPNSYEKAKEMIKKWRGGVENLPLFEVEIVTKSGEVKPYELNTDPVFENAQLTEIQIVARDISDRRKAEEKYSSESKLLNSLLNNADDLVYFKDKEGRYIGVSKTYASALGLNREEIEGKTVLDLFPDDQAKEMQEDDLKVMEQGEKVVDREHEVTLPDGTTHWFSTTKVPRYDDEGNIVGILGISRDITKRKEKEEELRFQGELLDQAEDAIIATDLEGEIIYWNEKAEELYGWEEEEVLGETIVDITPSLAAKDQAEEIMRKLRNGEKWSGEFMVKRKDDTEFPAIVTDAPIYDDNGELIGIVGVSTDISDRKEVEEREEFLHSLLRHDLRNKLQIILGYGELLKETGLSDEQEELVGKGWNAMHDALDLIEKVKKLREVSQEEIGVIEIGPVVKSAVDKYKQEASQRNIEIEIESDDYSVKGGTFLEELFSNLILNSIVHSDGGKIRIQVKEGDEEVVVRVEDDGKGIPDDIKDKIFERGFKTGETGGSGLGLYLVKEITETYRGSIEVKDSELGGARFDVRLEKA